MYNENPQNKKKSWQKIAGVVKSSGKITICSKKIMKNIKMFKFCEIFETLRQSQRMQFESEN
jgi:hypothetical protein